MAIQYWESTIPNRVGQNRYSIHQDIWRVYPNNHFQKQPFIFRVTDAGTVVVRSVVQPLWYTGQANAVVKTEDRTEQAAYTLSLHLNVHKRHGSQSLNIQNADIHPFVNRILEKAGLLLDAETLTLSMLQVRNPGVPSFPLKVEATVKILNKWSTEKAVVEGLGRLKYLGFGMPVLTKCAP